MEDKIENPKEEHTISNTREETVSLGTLTIKSPMGIGTWSWGNKDFGYGTYDSSFTDESIKDAFSYVHENGLINFWDTAEVYGMGKSEELLGACIKNYAAKSGTVVATKFLPVPWRITKGSMRSALVASLKRLQLDSVDLYQVHGPAYSLRSMETWADALAELVKDGLIKAVGVSNCNVEQMRRTHKALLQHNIPLASNQIEFSLLRTNPEHNGLLKTCKELGVAVLAYSPLAMGRLTGKYSKDNPPKGNRKFSNFPMEKIEPLLDTLREIAAKRQKTVPQVAINWCICKGTIPLVGVKNRKQAEENIQALGWRLTEEEVVQLDKHTMQSGWSWWQNDTR